MYITINNIKGEKRIDLSYSIQNFDSDKEIAVIRMLSDNVKYEILRTKSEKRNPIKQGIISTDGCTENCIKFRINAGDKSTGNAQDKAIADAYGNKFIIPLDFEMLDSAAPYYQAGLGNRLCYELIFNDYNQVTKSTVSPKVPDAKYKITDISLEYVIATQPDSSEIYQV